MFFNDIYFNVAVNVKKNLAPTGKNVAGRLWFQYYCNNMYAMGARNDSSRQRFIFFLFLKCLAYFWIFNSFRFKVHTGRYAKLFKLRNLSVYCLGIFFPNAYFAVSSPNKPPIRQWRFQKKKFLLGREGIK